LARVHQTPIISTTTGDIDALEGAREQCPVCGVAERGITPDCLSAFPAVRCVSCGALRLDPIPPLAVLPSLLVPGCMGMCVIQRKLK
jgi:hypothetical protein